MKARRSRATALRLGALGMATALAVAACSNGSGFTDDGADDNTTSSDEVTLTALVTVTDHLSKEWWEDLVAPFEKAHSGVTVEIIGPVSGGDVQSTLTELIASGDVPDVMHNLRPNRDNRDVLMDLSGEDWLADIPLAAAHEIDGAQYMTHAGIQLQGLWYYNKTAFEEANIAEAPTTVADLESAMDKLKTAGYVPLQTGADWITQQAFWGTSTPVVMGNDPDWYPNMREGRTTFSESYGPWLERWQQWIDKGYMAKDAMGLDYTGATDAFFAGESAIYPMGTWLVGLEEDAAPDFEVGVMAPPVGDQTDARVLGGSAGMMWTVGKETEHPNIAVELVKWLTTEPDAVAKANERDGNFRDGFEIDRSPLGLEVEGLLQQIGEDNIVPTGDGYGNDWAPAGFGNEVNTLLQGLWTGQAASDVGKAIDGWYQQNNS